MSSSLAISALNNAMAGVISRMFIGVLVTFLSSSLLVSSGLVPVLFSGLLGYVLIFAPLAMSLFIAFKGSTLSTDAIKFWFISFSIVMGLSLSLLFHIFTVGSIISALLGTVISFGALAGWGYFTKKDLSSWGSFLIAGVIGVVVISIINVFLGLSALAMVLNVLTIVIFLGLTAYDMNRLREEFWGMDEESIDRMSWFGALSLYINFINIFVSLLQLLGNKES